MRSSTVNSKLQHRRMQVENLNQVRALLVKLQGVFDLPKRLRKAIDQGAIEIAVDSYADAAPLLRKYGHKVCSYRLWSELPLLAASLYRC